MGTYQIGGSVSQSARYIGQYVAADDTIRYYYVVVAYDINSQPLTAGGFASAFGPVVLDGDHAISIQWLPILGAMYYNIYKSSTGIPASDGSAPLWWNASSTETGVLDVGYPCTTRNSFLNPGGSPIFLLQQPPAPVPPTDPCAGNPPGVMVPCPDVQPLLPMPVKEEIDYGLL